MAKSVGEYFHLTDTQMDVTITEVTNAIKNWKKEAVKIGVSRVEQEIMEGAFRI